MRSLYKISLAILAVGFLAVAGSAYAQDMAKPTPTFSGNVSGAFGSYTYDKTSQVSGAAANTKAYTEDQTSFEANLKWEYKTDSWYAMTRLRVRENNAGSGQPYTVTNASGSTPCSGACNPLTAGGSSLYIENWWTPGAFKLGVGNFQGSSPWQNPLAGDYYMRNSIGDSEYNFSWTGVPGIDAEYNLGIVQVGVAVSSQCVPSCNNAALSNGTTGTATAAQYSRAIVGTQTIAPHIAGATGPISFMAQIPQTSSTQNASGSTTSETLSGSGYTAGVWYTGPGGIGAGLDLQSFTDTKAKDTKVITTAQVKSRDLEGFDLRVDVPAGPGTVNVGYYSATQNANYDSKNYNFTNTTLRYLIPVSFGTIVPEYRTVTNGNAVAVASGFKKDATNSEFRLIMRSSF